MKVHRLLVDEIAAAIKEIFSSYRHADKVIEFYLKKNRRWGSRDRRFFAESVYDLVRWWRLYWSLAGFSDAHYRDGLSMTHQQILQVWATYWLSKKQDPLPWPEFKSVSARDIEGRRQQIQNSAILGSFPDELYQLGLAEWGPFWPAIVESLNKPADVYLRTNSLKIQRDDLKVRLHQEGIEADSVEGSPLALRLRERKNVFITEAFRSGFFEVQDLASQQIVPLLKTEPSLRVIDACAGAGGKSLHLAALMKNKGKILSLDVHQRKLDELRKRSSRNGIDIIETRWIENQKVIKRLEGTADRLLLDVPCSGLGVLKRNPDTKWKMTVADLEKLQSLQRQILQDYCAMTKIGGLMVYATCSLLPSENNLQVSWFLSLHPNWTLEREIFWRPDLQGADGFYGAVLHRLK